MYGKVELGFVEKAECPEELTSSYLPSKVGGKPAWLDPARLPTPEETTCSGCGLPCTFLLQVYAPLEDTPTAFHRTFFLFVCLNPSCHQRNSASAFRVFRSQLPKKNPYYGVDDGDGVLQPDGVDCEKGSASIEAVSVGGEQETSEVDCSTTSSPTQMEDSTTIADSLNGLSISEQSSGEHKGATEPTPLCIVCGSAGPKKCSRCKMVHYCSRHHQTYDWRNGHKLFCPDHASGKWRPQEVTYNPSYGVCLPEFLLVTEEEPAVEEGEGEGEERGEEERMSDYYKFVKSGKYCDHGSSKTGKKRVQSVMEKAESGTTSEKCFRAFRRRVAIEPEQVIRYQRGGLPLLVSREGAPQSTDTPLCTCGAKREFEFQVMPQLLYYLKLDTLSGDSVDWGTVIIYSCQASCSAAGPAVEFVWKQDFTISPNKTQSE